MTAHLRAELDAAHSQFKELRVERDSLAAQLGALRTALAAISTFDEPCAAKIARDALAFAALLRPARSSADDCAKP